jgi:hypothetical protein
MRIKELITEDLGFSHRKSSTMSATYAFPGMPSSNPYKAYRFAMAMANHKIKDHSGPADNYAVFVAYSDGDEEIISDAMKLTGEKSVVIADKGSHEPDSTYKISSVAKIKRNKYGV